MKGLKRYGGTFDETGSGANLNVGLFGGLVLIVFVVLGIVFQIGGFVVAGLILFVCFLVASEFVPGGVQSKVRKQRREELLTAARASFNAGAHTEAVEYFKKANIYGPLSKTDKQMYQSLTKGSKNA